MGLNRNNCKTFHRTLYSGMLESVTLLKRNDDQQQGTVKAIILYQCRRSKINKSGEPIAGDMSSDHRTVWHIPICEMERTGINHINAADRIVQREGSEKGRTWQPEADTMIDVKLFGDHTCIACKRVSG